MEIKEETKLLSWVKGVDDPDSLKETIQYAKCKAAYNEMYKILDEMLSTISAHNRQALIAELFCRYNVDHWIYLESVKYSVRGED